MRSRYIGARSLRVIAPFNWRRCVDDYDECVECDGCYPPRPYELSKLPLSDDRDIAAVQMLIRDSPLLLRLPFAAFDLPNEGDALTFINTSVRQPADA
jgi:hypothetical protein